MSASYSVKTTISAIDQASAVFRKVGQTARDAFVPITAFNKAIGAPQTTLLGRVGEAVDGVSAKFRSGLGSITAWLPALGALGSTATLGGLVAMTRSAAESFRGLTLEAERLGVSAKDLSAWRYGAKMTGVGSDVLGASLVRLKKSMYDAATGKNADVALLFQRMKISLTGVDGKVKNVDAALGDIAEAFKNTTDEEVKSRAALALFGQAGADLIPFLNRGRAGLAGWAAEMARYSGLSDRHKASLGTLAENFDKLDKAGSGLSARLAAAFAPALNKVVTWTENWIVANRELIAQALERKLDRVSRSLSALKRTSDQITKIPIIGDMVQGMDASAAFDIGLATLGVTMAGPVFAAVQKLTKAIVVLNLKMMTNPYLLAGALLIGVAVKLVKHWDEVKKEVSDAFEKWGPIGAIFQGINIAVNLTFAAINDVVKALLGIDLDKIFDDMLTGALDRVKSWIPKFEEVWERILPSYSGIVDAYRTSYSDQNRTPTVVGAPDGSSMRGIADAYRRAYAGVPTLDPLAAAVNRTTGAPQRVEVVVSADFTGLPPGARGTVKTEGATRSSVSVGRTMDAF